MKKIISILLAITFLIVSTFTIYAAEFTQSGNSKIPVSISYKDLTRLEEVANGMYIDRSYKIVNAIKYNGNSNIWIVRLSFLKDGESVLEDYVINLYPYIIDNETNVVTSLPFRSVEDGNKIFGPAWFYFGLLDNIAHNICGFGIAERINRWPKWEDLSFNGNNGLTYGKVGYIGSYKEPCSENFIHEHLQIS